MLIRRVQDLCKIWDGDAKPEHAIPLLARAFESQGQQDEVASLSVIGLSDRDQADLLTTKALANISINRIDIAAEQLEVAISKAPYSSYTRITTARLLALSGELEAAKEQTELVLNDDPEYAPAYSLLGDIERSLTNLVLAEEAYTKGSITRLIISMTYSNWHM